MDPATELQDALHKILTISDDYDERLPAGYAYRIPLASARPEPDERGGIALARTPEGKGYLLTGNYWGATREHRLLSAEEAAERLRSINGIRWSDSLPQDVKQRFIKGIGGIVAQQVREREERSLRELL